MRFCFQKLQTQGSAMEEKKQGLETYILKFELSDIFRMLRHEWDPAKATRHKRNGQTC